MPYHSPKSHLIPTQFMNSCAATARLLPHPLLLLFLPVLLPVLLLPALPAVPQSRETMPKIVSPCFIA